MRHTPDRYDELYVNSEPGALLNTHNMRDLRLPFAQLEVAGRPEEPCRAVLLAGLHAMQQLTHLNLEGALPHLHPAERQSVPPVAAYTALRASSQLQHLNISVRDFPRGMWQQLFEPGQQLQQLRVLAIDHTTRTPA